MGYDSNFNFDLKLPIPDQEHEEELLEFICKPKPKNLCENWLEIENIREQAESLPGAFTWDQDRRVSQEFTNSPIRQCHFYSRDREFLYRVGLSAMFGRHLFDFDETDI